MRKKLANLMRCSVSNAAYPYLLISCSIVILGAALLVNMKRQSDLTQSTEHTSTVSQVHSSLLLANRSQFLGDSKAPYTLVEFGDYECPPCRRIQKYLAEELNDYQGKIKLDFRQLPLTKIHPHAEKAALAAESARICGKFWAEHELMYTMDLSRQDAESRSLASVGAPMRADEGRKQLAADAKLAATLRVSSTPAFFLCRPDGSVVYLPTLKAIEQGISQ